MARPPHEDPEYQRQIVGTYRQGLLSMSSQQQQQQQQHQQHPQHQLPQLHQMSAAIKPPLPATPGSHQQPQLHHQHPSLNNNTISQGSNGSNGTSNNGSGAVHPHSNTSPLIHHNYTWSQVSPTSPQKHVRLSPRPAPYNPYPSPNYTNQISQQHHYQQQQQQHLGQIQLSPGGTNYHHQSGAGSLGLTSTGQSTVQSPLNGSGTFVAPGTSPSGSANRSPLSPNRRTRGENKKCRKVYGMDHKDQWCTQCKWKKACSRFGD